MGILNFCTILLIFLAPEEQALFAESKKSSPRHRHRRNAPSPPSPRRDCPETGTAAPHHGQAAICGSRPFMPLSTGVLTTATPGP